jgi:hypothetical protein
MHINSTTLSFNVFSNTENDIYGETFEAAQYSHYYDFYQRSYSKGDFVKLEAFTSNIDGSYKQKPYFLIIIYQILNI